jgi:hypothetical protein
MRGANLWAAAACSALLWACDDDHTGASEGITFFEHPDYEGDSITLAGGFSDFDDLRGPCNPTVDPVTGVPRDGDWDNCASSVLVDTGWEATVYEHDDYEGDTLVIGRNIADLDDVRGPCGDDWDDCISSIRVLRR